MDPHDPQIHGFFLEPKDFQERPGCQEHQPDQAAGEQEVQAQPPAHHFPAALQVPSPEILAGEGSDGLAERDDERIAVDFQYIGCRRSRHGQGSFAVDGGLDHHIGQVEHHALDPGRHPHPEDFPDVFPADPDSSRIKMEHPMFIAEHPEQEPGTYIIGHRRSHYHAGQAEPQKDRQKIPCDIDQAGGDQRQQRSSDIPMAAVNGREKIVQGHPRHAQQVNPQVEF